jgi:ATP-binding cassette subfamily C protein
VSTFLLNGDDRAWRIEEGVVDLFSVPLKDGKPEGARSHLLRLETGHSFSGVGGAPGDIGLLAVASPGALLIPGERDADGIAEWLRALADVAAGRAPGPPFVADPPEDVEEVLEQVSAGRGAEEALATHQLFERKRTDERLFDAALDNLAQVMAGSDKDTPRFVRTGDLLVDAVRQVLSATGVRTSGDQTAPEGDDNADSATRIDRLAREASAGYRIVALDGRQWWNEDAGPLLAFRRKTAEAVALIPLDRGHGYCLMDPASGDRVRVDHEVARCLEPQAFMFFRSFPDEPIGLLELLRFGMRGTGPDIRRVIFLGTIGGVMGLGVPIATGMLIDTVIPTAHKTGLVQLILLLITTTIGISAFEFTRGIALLRIDARVTVGAQAAMMQRVLRLPATFFRDHAAGDLTQRMFGITQILQLVSAAAQTALLSWIFSLASFAYLFLVDWRLGLITSALVAFALVVTVILNLLRLRLERRMFEAQGDIASRVFQLLTGVAKLRANGAEKRAFSLWAGAFAYQKTLDFGIRRIANLLDVFNAGYIVLASLVLFAAVAVLLPDMNAGAFAGFNVAFSQFFAATMAMTAALTASLNIIPLYERSRVILHSLPEPNLAQGTAGVLSGAIDISHVDFSYSPDGPLILDDVTVRIAPGEFVAVVGASGSGKSTLFRLLLGFEQPQGGAIYYDGQDLSTLDLRAVRKQLGVVLQNGKLMPGELYTNIIGSSNLTIDDAWAAARLAGMEDDIKAMPMGMHTVIAEGAGVISGGQKQRLMIARAVAGKPRVLLFDEATSALDNHTQATVSHSVKSLRATRVVIAHRLSTIVDADRILVMDAGKLVESGSYSELMAKGGHFAALAKRQIA